MPGQRRAGAARAVIRPGGAARRRPGRAAAPPAAPAGAGTSITASARSSVTAATAAASSAAPDPAMISAGRSARPRTSARAAKAAARLRAAGTQTRAVPVAASCRASSAAGAGPAAARIAAAAAFTSGPPSAMRKSGRLESTSRLPYRGPSGNEVVAVTPCRASAASSARTPARVSPAAPLPPASRGVITSATPMAWYCVPAPVPPGPGAAASATRATEPTPNHSWAGLSRVNGFSATSVSAGPGGRPMTDTAVWNTGSPPGTCAGKATRSSLSEPTEPSTWVRNSTRSAPSHSNPSEILSQTKSAYQFAQATYNGICSIYAAPSFCTDPEAQANYQKAKIAFEAALRTAQAAISAANGNLSAGQVIAALQASYRAYLAIVNDVQFRNARLRTPLHPLALIQTAIEDMTMEVSTWLKRHAEMATHVGVLVGGAMALITVFGGAFPPWYTPAQAMEDQRSAALNTEQQTVQALGRINEKLDTVGRRVDRMECLNLIVTFQQAQSCLSRRPSDQMARALRDSVAGQMRQLPSCTP